MNSKTLLITAGVVLVLGALALVMVKRAKRTPGTGAAQDFADNVNTSSTWSTNLGVDAGGLA